METKELMDSVASQATDTLSTKTHSIAAWLTVQAASWTITLTEINQMLSALSLTVATAYTLYLFFLKIKGEQQKKSPADKG